MRSALYLFASIVAIGATAACGSSAPSSPSTPPSPPPAATACGAVNAQRISGLAIWGGTECQSGTSPVVMLKPYDETGNHFVCSGTVIAPHAVLTARHCVNGMLSISIAVGSADVIKSTTFPKASDADVAIVVTDFTFPQTPVPLLVSRDPQKDEPAVIAGYGQNEAGVQAVLRAGTTTISAVTTDTITTQYNAVSGTSGVCYGDSGGPLMVLQGGAWALAGVASSIGGNSCSSTSNNFVNVKNPAVQAFIASVVPNLPGR